MQVKASKDPSRRIALDLIQAISSQDPFLFTDHGAREFTNLVSGSVGGQPYEGGVGYFASTRYGDVSVKIIQREGEPESLTLMVTDQEGLSAATKDKVWRKGHIHIDSVALEVRGLVNDVSEEIRVSISNSIRVLKAKLAERSEDLDDPSIHI